MRLLICSICFTVLSTHLHASGLNFIGDKINPDSTILSEESIIQYTIADSILDKIPFKNQNNLNRIYPGVVSYFRDFYIRGGANYETGFFIDGTKFNDLFTGKNSFFLNPNTFEKIEFYNGFIPNDFGNVSSGLFNYKLRTGGEKISFEAEHLGDNITFTNDAFSGKKRLGTYYYGHNETNINVGGPLYFSNIRFFANVNYLFQRDKNPQRYPGADNVTFIDDISYNPDSITINLPAGIVPLNSFESFNFLSTLFFDFEDIKIKASGIYFDENTFAERNHISDYLNTRAGLVDKSGGIINVNIHHKLNEALSYSLNGNYSSKNEVTSDQYLGDDYWSYGDSVANANAGVIWQKSEQDLINYHFGRYALPTNKYILGNYFIVDGYPGIEHQKSEQSTISFSGVINYKFQDHQIRIGTEYYQHELKYWQLDNQSNLAGEFAYFRENPGFSTYSDEELKEYLIINRGVNNIGYASDGSESKLDLNDSPKPVNYSFYIDDYFDAFNNFQFYLGLRYDYFDFDKMKLIDPASPEKTIDFSTNILVPGGLIESETYSFVSPKVAIKIQASNNLAFTASYSQNVQEHPYSDIYEGLYSVGYKLRAGSYLRPAIKGLKPIVSKSVEIGIEYSTVTNLNLKLILFNKNSTGIIKPEIQMTNTGSPYQSYNFLSDSGIINLNGIEFLLDYFYKGFYISSTLNYQSIKPSIEFYRAAYTFSFSRSPQINSTRTNKFSANILTAYDLSDLSSIFKGINISAIYNFNTGHPYVKSIDFAVPNSGYIEETTPNVSQIDMKVEKNFELFNGLNLGLYFYVINLLDTKNIYEVFSTTGKVDDDGYSILYASFTHSEEEWAKMLQLHQLFVDYNPGGQQIFYGPPRQIGFGIKLNY